MTNAKTKTKTKTNAKTKTKTPLAPPTTAIRIYQSQVTEWVQRNFGDKATKFTAIVGLTEEVGELCRAVVKRSQGIRGTKEEWDAEIEKELGDIFIKLCDTAGHYGVDLQDAIETRWAAVKQRNWQENPQGHGIPGDQGDQE